MSACQSVSTKYDHLMEHDKYETIKDKPAVSIYLPLSLGLRSQRLYAGLFYS